MKLEGLENAWFGVIAALALAGCGGATTPDTPSAADDRSTPPAGGPVEVRPAPSPAPAPFGEALEESIYRIRHPGNRVLAGTRVVLGGPTIQVTAASATRIWIQEAGGDGRCEVGDDVVAYRAIEVEPAGAVPRLERGQLVEVEGIVSDTDGRRTLTGATVKAIGAPVEPYVAHCERDGSKLGADALDAVLVLTAGSTESLDPPTSDGSWSLATCFGSVPPSIAIGAEMAANGEWSPTWYWVRGVVTRRGGAVRLEPRDAEDILGQRHDDACL